MNLAHPCADSRRRLDLCDIGVDEYAGDDSRVVQPGNDIGQSRLLREHVEPPFGRHLLPPFRNQHRHFRAQIAGDPDHLVGRGHFQIELDAGEIAQLAYIVILYVPTILPQVHGDSIRTPEMGLHRSPHGIRLPRPPRLTQRCHVVDIDSEFDHSSCNSLSTRRD